MILFGTCLVLCALMVVLFGRALLNILRGARAYHSMQGQPTQPMSLHEALRSGEPTYDEEKKLLTVETSIGTFQYVGSCTVWRELPSFRRCVTSTESVLADLCAKARHMAEFGPPEKRVRSAYGKELDKRMAETIYTMRSEEHHE